MKHKRPRWLSLAAVGLLLPLLLGMGSMGGGPEENEAPQPDYDFHATVVDRSGLSTQIAKVSIEGKTYIAGTRGETQVAVPFDRIQKARFFSKVEDKLSVEITLKDGQSVELEVTPKQRAYGEASFGVVSLLLKDAGSITFDLARPPQKIEKPEVKRVIP